MNELVSVIVPSYNSGKYILETLQSVIAQTYGNWECIIVDDGSTDNTAVVVKEFISSDSRFIYHYQKNKGLAGARNTGIELSKGTYIQFLDSDDVIFPVKLERMLEAYRSNPNSGTSIYFSDFNFTKYENPFIADEGIRKLHKNLKPIQGIDFRQLYHSWDLDFVIPTHAFLFPKKALTQKKYDETLKSKEDWDFYLSILSDQSITLDSIDFIGCGYRLRPNSMSQDFTTLLKYAIIISHKWKRNNRSYFLKMSAYYFQAYIYLIKKKTIRIKTLNSTIKELHGKLQPFILFYIHLIMPFIFIRKTVSVIYSRK